MTPGRFEQRRGAAKHITKLFSAMRERAIVPGGSTVRITLPEDTLYPTAWIPSWDSSAPLVLAARHPRTGQIALLHVLTTDLEADLADPE